MNEGEGWNNRKGRVLMMGGECFVEQGGTMCCAYSMCGPVRDTHSVMPAQQQQQQQQQSQNTYPGQAPQQNQSMYPGQMPQQPGNTAGGPQRSGFDKYASQIESKIPPQYQGYFNKAKKFFK